MQRTLAATSLFSGVTIHVHDLGEQEKILQQMAAYHSVDVAEVQAKLARANGTSLPGPRGVVIGNFVSLEYVYK